MQNAKETAQDVKNTFFSGAPGTTGREVFEDNTATGPGTTRSGASSGAPAENVSYPTGGNHALGGQTGSGLTGHHSSHAGEGIAAAATGGATATGAHHGHHDHSHEHSHHSHGHHGASEPAVGATGTTLRTGQEDALAPRGSDEVGAGSHGSSGLTGGSGRATTDKTGSLQQDSHLYERTGIDGPLTSGAAGTDRFDTDKPRSGETTGTTRGPTNDIPTGEAGSSPKKSGGVMGVLGTSGHDFTNNRSRIAKEGAYNDSEGHFKSNTDGPGGSALTGREGNDATNPVAQHQSRTDGTGEHKKGLMEKVKDALS